MLLVFDVWRLRALARRSDPPRDAPIQIIRVICQFAVAFWYARVVSLICTIYVDDVRDLSPLWLYVACTAALSLMAAAGAALVGNCGSQRCPFFIVALITVSATLLLTAVLDIEVTTPLLASLAATAGAVICRGPKFKGIKSVAYSQSVHVANVTETLAAVGEPQERPVSSDSSDHSADKAEGLRRRQKAQKQSVQATISPSEHPVPEPPLPAAVRGPKRRSCGCARRFFLTTGVLTLQAAFWGALGFGALLHAEVSLSSAADGGVETFKVGELLWSHHEELLQAAAALAGRWVWGGGSSEQQAWWEAPELQAAWHAFQQRQERPWEGKAGRQHAGRGGAGAGWGWSREGERLRRWLGGGGSTSAESLLRELGLPAPESPHLGQGEGAGHWFRATQRSRQRPALPSAATLRTAYRARALELHPDRLPPGATEDERVAAAEAFERMHTAYQQLLAMRRRQPADAAEGQ